MKRITIITLAMALLSACCWAFNPGVYDIIMQAGEDYTLHLQFKDSTGAAMDLNGYSYASQFRSAPAPGGVVYATYSAAIFGDATSGRVRVKLSHGQTTTNSGRSGVWDLRQTAPSGEISYMLTGKAAVKPTVTR